MTNARRKHVFFVLVSARNSPTHTSTHPPLRPPTYLPPKGTELLIPTSTRPHQPGSFSYFTHDLPRATATPAALESHPTIPNKKR